MRKSSVKKPSRHRGDVIAVRATPEVLQTLRNIGPRTACWRWEAGIRPREDLNRIGTIDVFRRMRLAGHPVPRLAVHALDDALMDAHWNAIPVPFKRQLAIDFKRMIPEEHSEATVSQERASSGYNHA